jgi:prolyl-tRNA editing enzyme YbaK/EbsC (Cys-tRNA(Pro) deacylase)
MRDQVRTSYRISSVAMVSKAIGGVSPIGWTSQPEMTLIDQALNDYPVVWAASGHPHAVYPTSFDELVKCTGAKPMVVGE